MPVSHTHRLHTHTCHTQTHPCYTHKCTQLLHTHTPVTHTHTCHTGIQTHTHTHNTSSTHTHVTHAHTCHTHIYLSLTHTCDTHTCYTHPFTHARSAPTQPLDQNLLASWSAPVSRLISTCQQLDEHIKFIHRKCTVQWVFLFFTEWCNYHHNLILEHFHHPQKMMKYHHTIPAYHRPLIPILPPPWPLSNHWSFCPYRFAYSGYCL